MRGWPLMSLFKPSTFRRREVRKAMPRKRGMVRELLRRGDVMWGVAVVGVFLLSAGFIVVQGRIEPPYRPGQLVDRSRIARVRFDALDKAKTEEARKLRSDLQPPIYAL